ncbi:MAG: hypothetical protein BWY82_01032 [Verrucomicrobia bacterium ADurb.Bin474]|nr:MAG: hypothetical protein BWY82_01032 [Verrucomicrobia bacterium ADurb.Bin474]
MVGNDQRGVFHHALGKACEMGHKPDEDAGVDDVEDAVEQGHVDGNISRFVSIDREDHIHCFGKRHKEGQRPDHTDNIENKVGTCGTFGVDTATDGGQVGGDGGTYVFSKDDRTCGRVVDPAFVGHGQRDSSCHR